ncbi:flavodoxin domain-containing protein [Sphaerisporangium sp. TRM90804]|uniref:flavodoxin domain-containing protein n=1 Tax=Sphaerisporangium sp. TRM90804 TaxID=3031113 RepID=UPI002447CE32|nr:flavodoxin domain-containing protein [Sphaerisporangium sp. TRM90804]MDH2426219.1 flavodoxin domain-containing protein [Sphaerisporangium sp. TRM90804]
MTRILVAHGSKRGSTAEIAEWIGEMLRSDGHHVDVAPARETADVREYEAVILGGALYGGRWHKDARRFARRHAQALRGRALWLFSSGPLDRTAAEKRIPAVPGVARSMARLGAKGHVTFGGRLAPGQSGFLASAIAKKMAGDYRDREQVTAWAKGVSAELDGPTRPLT